MLGVMFAMLGIMKLAMAQKMMGDPKMAWVEREGLTKARLAGAAELAAGMAFVGTAIGIGFLEDGVLASVAAVGTTLAMILAVRVHQPHDEPIVMSVALGVLSVVLALLLALG